MKTYLDSHVAAIQSLIRLGAELRSQYKTKNKLVGILRRLLEDPLVIANTSSLHTAPGAIMSKTARAKIGDTKILSHSHGVSLGLRWEHPVPNSVLVAMLTKAVDDASEIEDILVHYFQPAWITCEEDKALNKAGYKSKMPPGWQRGDDKFARYHSVGISIAP